MSRAVRIGRSSGSMTVGAKPCGKRFCPNCAPRIQAVRRDEIRECVEAARSMGWTTLFLTSTLGHDRSDSLDSLLEALKVAWSALTHGGFWSRIKRRHGVRHHVRVTEIQEGGAFGWHPHLHTLLFIDTSAAKGYDVAALERDIVAEWTRIVTAGGHRASSSAQRLIEPTEEHLALMSGYFTKQLADGLAWELTGSDRKSSRGESRNPAQLLQAAIDGDRGAVAAWQELEEATKGRQLIGYSAHCRRDLHLEPTQTVEEMLRDQPEPAEALVDVDREDWEEHASRAGFREALAAVVEDPRTSATDLLWWLDARGVRARAVSEHPPRPPAPPEDGPPGREWLALPDENGGFS